MTENFKRAGLLLKLSIILYIGAAVFLKHTMIPGVGVVALMLIMSVFYFFAHMVQLGKQWTKYPILIYAGGSTLFAAFDTFALISAPGNFDASRFLIGGAIILPVAMIIWAAVLVVKPQPDDQYDHDEPIDMRQQSSDSSSNEIF